MNRTAQRIRRRWARQGHKLYGSNGHGDEISSGDGSYSGSSVTPVSQDFLGDWRSADTWMRFDMWRVRARSRQLERGNPWCVAFKRNMLNNVLGYKGFLFKSEVVTDTDYGDSTDGQPDAVANTVLENYYAQQGAVDCMTSRKRLNRAQLDRLILSRLIFDGEIFLRKLPGFDNDCSFTWQTLNSDYLDYNYNDTAPNGNIIVMGVEMDPQYKFPVAYHFNLRRPNDYVYNYWLAPPAKPRERVPADQVIHLYLSTEDDEQTRGFPWIFAAMLVLFRMGKYHEAALINAAIGASRGVYYEKEYPEGFTGDPTELDDDAVLTLDLPQGSGLELPYGVRAKMADMKYPDQDFAQFNNALLLATSSVFGTSYATSTGDLAQANFVSSRLGQLEEREQYKFIQQYFIDNWKRPGYGEELYRGLVAQTIALPISKYTKLNQGKWTGRRWPFVQPVDDMKGKEMAMNNLITSISDIIEETTQESAEDVFERISKDNELMKEYGLTRILTGLASSEQKVTEPTPSPDDGSVPGGGTPPKK